ncbi:MAG: type II toxin-antitoxin system VapC family toxin [Archaeoglobales archaeon]|nr:type II toxin-antitoxin system VapC family toxin [Archaeoglobales archaeon]
MTEGAIFIDSSAFLSFFMEGIDLFQKLSGELVTSVNVIEEVVYILIKEKAREITKMDKHYDLLIYLRENPETTSKIAEEVISDISAIIDYFGIMVLPTARYEEMFEIIKKYGLLPNDALIAATCKHYGIRKIATFDEDFKRVDFLEVLEL